jgi:hypothetical protein
MNSEAFLSGQATYFAGAYERFLGFGGPCVYFHRECLRARDVGFLSDRHLEMLYATLTAWGMHRMGDAERTKAKLAEWGEFRDSLLRGGTLLGPALTARMRGSTEHEYAEAISALWPCYRVLHLSVSEATVVANSKALFHLLPELVPPIDRQYTVRFFGQKPEDWRDGKGKFRPVTLPQRLEDQFELFRNICVKVKHLADGVVAANLDNEQRQHGLTAPKAIDNAIVNYVKIVSGLQSEAP